MLKGPGFVLVVRPLFVPGQAWCWRSGRRESRGGALGGGRDSLVFLEDVEDDDAVEALDELSGTIVVVWVVLGVVRGLRDLNLNWIYNKGRLFVFT